MPSQLWLIRHGETEWTVSGAHTGSTDIPLTEAGRRQALKLKESLAGRGFALVLTSPLSRARETCNLAGFGGAAQIDPNLVECRYGDYRRTHHGPDSRGEAGMVALACGCAQRGADRRGGIARELRDSPGASSRWRRGVIRSRAYSPDSRGVLAGTPAGMWPAIRARHRGYWRFGLRTRRSCDLTLECERSLRNDECRKVVSIGHPIVWVSSFLISWGRWQSARSCWARDCMGTNEQRSTEGSDYGDDH